MVISSKRAYATPRSTVPGAPAPAAVHRWHVPPQETSRHSSVSVSVGSLGPGVHKVCMSPLSISGGYGVWFQMLFPTSYHLAGASPLPLDVAYLLKVAPAPHSHHSSAYHLAGASLLLDNEVHLAKVKTFRKGLNVILNSVFINSSKKVGTVLFSSDDNAIVIFKIMK